MNALELQGLTKHYKDFTLGPLDLTLPGGTICGLIGENGAGKSTTIRLILDMVQRDGGTVTILGRDSRTASVRSKEEIGVVLGSATGKERFTDAAALLDYGFSNYMIYTPGLPEEALQPVPVVNGMQSQVAVESAASGSVLLTKGREKDLKTEVKLSESVEAPVAKGQQLGKIVYTLDGEVLTEYPITAAGDVEQISFFSALGILARELLRL